MKRLKRVLSSILTFAMLTASVTAVNTSSAFAEGTTRFSFDFRSAPFSSCTTSATYYVTENSNCDTVTTDSSDTYDLKIGPVKYYSSTYGFTGGTFTATFKIKAPAAINFGTADYYTEFSLASSDTSAKFAGSDYYYSTDFNNSGNKNSSTTVYYESSNTDSEATVTLTAASRTNYLPSIAVTEGVTLPTLSEKPVGASFSATFYKGDTTSPLASTPITAIDKDYTTDSNGQIGFTDIENGTYTALYKENDTLYKGTMSVSDGAVDNSGVVKLMPVTSTDFGFDFTGGSIITSDLGQGNFYLLGSNATKTAPTYYEGYVEQNVKTHNSNYGICGAASTFKITLKDVIGPAEIILGTSNYTGTFNLSAASGSGGFVNNDGIAVTQIDAQIDSGYNPTGNTVTRLWYTGTDTTDIVLSGVKGGNDSSNMYFPYIYVCSNSNIPQQTKNSSTVLNVTGANDGDYVEIVDSEGTQLVKQIVGGKVDFTGEGIACGTATYEVIGYKVSDSSDLGTIDITSGSSSFNVTVSTKATQDVPSDESNTYLYAGYAPTAGYNTYTTIQQAIDAAETNATIVVADGTYHEVYGLTIPAGKDNITLKGASEDASKVVIWDNDYEGGSDSKGFHGDTLLVNGKNFTASNITIMNNIEETAHAETVNIPYNGKNATALGIGSSNASASLSNCRILATRDTIYTGSYDNNGLSLSNCTITGFQDTICGGGKLVMNNCTMDPTLGTTSTVFTTSTARLLVPKGNNTRYIVSNLTINATQDADSSCIYLGRPWDESQTGSILVVNGYNLTGDAATGFDNALAKGSYGFSPDGISVTDATKNFLWLVRKNQDRGLYNTTLSTLSDSFAYSNCEKETDSSAAANTYRLIGKASDSIQSLIKNATVTDVGFVAAGGTTDTKISNEVVYNVAGDSTDSTDSAGYYTVNFVLLDTSKSYTLSPYITYAVDNALGYDIASGTTETLNVTAQ